MTEAVIRIFESELAGVAAETAAHRSIETGGSLFGLWTDSGNATVMLATGPGPRARRAATHFEQDPAAHQAYEAILLEAFGLQGIGLWHSHHYLGLRELSGGDVGRAVGFARRSGRNRFCDLLTYFDSAEDHSAGVATIKPFVHPDAAAGRWAPSSIVVLPGVSPVRKELHTAPARLGVQVDLALAPGVRYRLATSATMPEMGRVVTELAVDSIVERAGTTREQLDRAWLADLDTERHAIGDPHSYIRKNVEPLVRPLRSVAHCELDEVCDGQLLALSVRTLAGEHVVVLGEERGKPAVLLHLFRAGQGIPLEQLNRFPDVAAAKYLRAVVAKVRAQISGR